MITPSFSLTATERVLPKLALDFTTANLDSRVTFTRTTDATHPATYVNSSGYVTSATNNQPRFDYSSSSVGTCKGLLIEESRTNITTYSEDLGSNNWAKFNATVTQDATNAPSNLQTADKLIEDNTLNTHYTRQVIALSNATYSYSVFLKAGERTLARIGMTDLATGDAYVDVNLSNGILSSTTTSGSWSNTSATITAYPNSWYRVTITSTKGGGTYLANYVFLMSDASTTNYQGNGTSGLYVWGIQLEAGAFATSYIPTTSAALTRNADVVTVAGQGVAAQGTFVVDATVVSGNTLLISGSVTFAATYSTAQKTAVSYDATSVLRSVNAGTVTSSVGATAGADIALGNGGHFKKVALYLPKMNNNELQAFSK